jgi:putative inorganic carbon (HCO3(-)) transporter
MMTVHSSSDRSRWIEAAARLAILLLAAPVFLFPRRTWGALILIVPVLWVVRWIRHGSPIPITPVSLPMLGLSLMLAVSLWATPDLEHSARKVIGLVYGIALFYALLDLGDAVSLWWPTALLLAMGSGIALVSFLGTRWPVKFGILRSLVDAVPTGLRDRMPTDAFNPNGVAATLILFVPLQITVLVALLRDPVKRRVWRWVASIGVGLSLLLTGGVLLLTQSRAAWVALALGLASLVWVVWRRARLPMLIFVALVGVVGGAVIGPEALRDWATAVSAMEDVKSISFAGRLEIWSRALYGIADFFFTGMGMDMFREVVWILYPLFTIPPDQDIGHAHNIYFQTALDLGVPGLIGYLALVGTVLYVGYRTFARAETPRLRWIALGATTGVLTHGLWGLVDALALGSRSQFTWWWVLALAMVGVRCRSGAGNGST